MKKYYTVLYIVCAWCGASMGEKNGKGIEGTTSSICKKCAKGEYKKLGLRFPKPWNLVGRLVEHFRRKRLVHERDTAEDTAAELERHREMFTRNPRLHAHVLLTGRPLVHYVDLVDLSDLKDAVADEPEMKCRWN